jgi:glycine dehydrogenase subunit 1
MPFILPGRRPRHAQGDRCGSVICSTRFAALKIGPKYAVPPGLNEMDVMPDVARAAQDGTPLTAGAGAYEHQIPAVGDQLARVYSPTRLSGGDGQARCSWIYEYQTMMTRLTGMDVSNASLTTAAPPLAVAASWPNAAPRKAHAVLFPGACTGLSQDPAHDRRPAEDRSGRSGFLS